MTQAHNPNKLKLMVNYLIIFLNHILTVRIHICIPSYFFSFVIKTTKFENLRKAK